MQEVIEPMSKEYIKSIVPSSFRKHITDDVVEEINTLGGSDESVASFLIDNFVKYTIVLQDQHSRFRIRDYINAIKYITYKAIGDTNVVAYSKTFPDRYQRMLAINKSKKDMNSIISAYGRTDIVKAILEKTYANYWVLNQDAYQKAIETQVDIMENAKSELARVKAADSILTHLGEPQKAASMTINNLNVNKDNVGKSLQEALTLFAEQVRSNMQNGQSTKKAMEHNIKDYLIIDAEVEPDE